MTRREHAAAAAAAGAARRDACAHAALVVMRPPWIELRDLLPALAASVLEWLLLLALLVALGRLAWLLLPRQDVAPDTPARTASAAPAGEAPAVPAEVATITAMHLFGRASAPTDPPPPAGAPVELTLRGVLLSDLPDATRALIARAGGPDVAYAPGAVLPGGARLVEVRPAEVVIWRESRTQTLRLNPGAGALAGTRLEEVDHRGNEAMARQLAALQRQLQRDPASSVGLLRFEPLHRQGRLIGFRVNPGRAQDLLASLGLRPGDVISAVNGIALESIPNGFDALEQLTSAAEVRLDIARGDAHIVYAYRVAR
jgi:general secretion pathway protein C